MESNMTNPLHQKRRNNKAKPTRAPQVFYHQSFGAETIHGNQLTLAGYPVHSFLSFYGKAAADPRCLL
jgi:hypothetical protein